MPLTWAPYTRSTAGTGRHRRATMLKMLTQESFFWTPTSVQCITIRGNPLKLPYINITNVILPD